MLGYTSWNQQSLYAIFPSLWCIIHTELLGSVNKTHVWAPLLSAEFFIESHCSPDSSLLAKLAQTYLTFDHLFFPHYWTWLYHYSEIYRYTGWSKFMRKSVIFYRKYIYTSWNSVLEKRVSWFRFQSISSHSVACLEMLGLRKKHFTHK